MTLGMRFDNLPAPVALTVGEGHWAKSWQDSVPSSLLNFLSVQTGKEDPIPQSPCRVPHLFNQQTCIRGSHGPGVGQFWRQSPEQDRYGVCRPAGRMVH